jgi:hypothetical protein
MDRHSTSPIKARVTAVIIPTMIRVSPIGLKISVFGAHWTAATM